MENWNKEIKEEWLSALRSGEYKQGCSGFLKYKDEYCCLGVRCDLLTKRGQGQWRQNDGIGSLYKFVDSEGNISDVKLTTATRIAEKISPLLETEKLLADETLELSEVQKEFLLKVGKLVSLEVLNDSRIIDFKLMADIIERYIPC